MKGERGPTDSEVPAGAVRRLVQALRDHLTLSRFHAIVGIIAGFISISVGLVQPASKAGPIDEAVGAVKKIFK